MNRKQRRARLKLRREALQRLTGPLAPGSYVGTSHVKDGVLGLLVETPQGPVFVPHTPRIKVP